MPSDKPPIFADAKIPKRVAYAARAKFGLSGADEARIALLATLRKDAFVSIQPAACPRYPSPVAQVVRVYTAGPGVLVRCRFGCDARGRSILRWVPVEDLLLPLDVSRAA